MIQSYHHGRFELFVVVIVIAIIALVALERYVPMADDARILQLRVTSQHFLAGAANARMQFLLLNDASKTPERSITNENKTLYFSVEGWPVSTIAAVAEDYRPTDGDCYQLWMVLLQNPPPIDKGRDGEASTEYRTFAQPNNCRYAFVDDTAYFDYYPLDGKLIFTVVTPKSAKNN